MANSEYDVFISYRRIDGYGLAKDLYRELMLAGYRVFMDHTNLSSGKFDEQLLQVIQQCTDVLIILSPHALDRCGEKDDWVRQEIECALVHQKNIIPIMMENFYWPKPMPEGMNGLDKYQALEHAERDSERTCLKFIGMLTVLQKKLLKSKTAEKSRSEQKVEETESDQAFDLLYHQFQYLMRQNKHSEAEKKVKEMEGKHSGRAESYLCRVQHSYRVTDWKLLGTITEAFENHAAWTYAMELAQPQTKTILQELLAASLALRKKQAEEARREAEIRKLQEPRHKPAKEPVAKSPKAITKEEAARIRDTILARTRRLNEHPLAIATKLKEVYAIRDMITSIHPIIPMREELKACADVIEKLLRQAAEEAVMASEILSCYVVLGEIQGVHAKYAGRKFPAGTVPRKDIQPQEGVMQCCMRENYRLALLADGSVLPLDAASTTWMGSEAEHWDNITWLDGSVPTGVRGFRKDGTYVFAPDEAQPTHYECEAIADSSFEYRASGIRLRKAAPEDSRVLLSYDGTLTLRDEKHPASGPVLHKDVIGFHIRGYTCFALLRNGHVAEIDLTTRACREFSCAMTEEAVQMGVRNWRRNRAEELLALRKKQLRNPALLALALLGGSFLLGPMGFAGAGAAAFSLSTRREKCQQSIESLKALLAEK